jgi:PAP2 superfamily protein
MDDRATASHRHSSVLVGSSATALPLPLPDIVRRLAVQDWVLLLYFVALFVIVVRGEGPLRPFALGWVTFDLVALVTTLVLYRGQLIRPSLGSVIYRVAVLGTLLGSFFQLEVILPTASSRIVDAQIYAFDMRVFHVEPAVAWDRFVTPRTTEWFAFFYWSYFFILALFVIPFTFFARNKKVLSEFSLGIVTVFCVAHLLYMAVPAYGPWRAFAGEFAHPLEGNLWWPLVKETVDSAGARKDVFPSLHTAAPTFLALFAFRNRRHLPRFTWLAVGFFASQIVLATMFLRWHYLIDIVAGLTLASSAILLTARLRSWEAARRERLGLGAVWIDAPWSGVMESIGDRLRGTRRAAS